MSMIGSHLGVNCITEFYLFWLEKRLEIDSGADW